MKMSTLMSSYFEKQLLSEAPSIKMNKLPIEPKKTNEWAIKENPSRFHRKFKFKDHNKFLRFINALLEYEGKVKHNAKIIIGYPEVIIQVWTHSLEDITDMDREYIKEVEYILEEIE